MKKYLPFLLLLVFYIPCLGQEQAKSIDALEPLPEIKLKNQPRFVINVHSGYNIGLGSTFKFYPDDVISIKVDKSANNPEVKTIRYKEHSEGLGEGLTLGVGFSYIINDFVNVGMDLDYFKSTISKIRDSSYSRLNTGNSSIGELIYNERYKISYDATLFTLSPNITFKAISTSTFFIYNKIGAIVILGPNSTQRESRDGTYKLGQQGVFRDSASYNEKRFAWGIKNPAFGFMAGIGAQKRVSEKIRVFTELQFSHVLYRIQNRVLTNFFVNGLETVNTLPLRDREIVFQHEVSSDQIDLNPNKPSIEIYQKFPITYVGLQLGFAYRF